MGAVSERILNVVSKTVNESSIEIKSKCISYPSFEVQNDWFSLIETEIENQDKFWGDIVPKGNIWKLPTLKPLICELEGSVSLGKKSSRLGLDSSRIYDFLNGRFIYKNPLACILELLQNAVDATIDRIWLENKDKIDSIKTYQSLVSDHKIIVEVTTAQLQQNKVAYNVAISDTGKGMSLEEIKSILTIASSSNQKDKDKLRLGMPSWMRPSGFFGIGLHSVFSLTEELSIRTKSASDSLYEITIKTTKGKTPSFVVKKRESIDWVFGTTVSFTVIDDAIPDRISGNYAIFEGLSKFDPLKDSVLNIKEKQIEEQVAKFAQYSEFEIMFNGIKLESSINQFQIVDVMNGIEYAIEFTPQAHLNNWAFRGIPFETNSRHKYFNIKGNIISERADSFLSLNREKIHRQGQELLDDKIFHSLSDMRDEVMKAVTNKNVASLYYFLFDNGIDQSWKDIRVSGYKLSELLEVGKSIDISFDFDVIEPSDKKILVGNRNGDADMLTDVIHKLNFGLVIHDIFEIDTKIPHMTATHKSTIYSVELVSDIKLSRIEPKAISYLSLHKLSKMRVRYWLPCGETQLPEISISNKAEYPWIETLTNFSQFFTKGIILRSTAKSLEEDLPTLVKTIRNSNSGVSEAAIEKELRDFYTTYSFESKDYRKDFLSS